MRNFGIVWIVITAIGCAMGPRAVSRRPDPSGRAECGSHVECYNESLHNLKDAEALLRSSENSLRMVGAVVPFYLSPSEVTAMAPVWVPADGRILDDPKSNYNAKILPDLRNRFALGADANDIAKDITIPSDENQTRNPVAGSVKISAKTSGADIDVHRNRVGTVGEPEYTIDTEKDETRHGNHSHTVDLTVPFPPFRKLIYMIRVRPFAP